MKRKALTRIPAWEKGRLTEDELMGIGTNDYGPFMVICVFTACATVAMSAFLALLFYCLRHMHVGM